MKKKWIELRIANGIYVNKCTHIKCIQQMALTRAHFIIIFVQNKKKHIKMRQQQQTKNNDNVSQNNSMRK